MLKENTLINGHACTLFNKWGIKFYMLKRAVLWQDAINSGTWEAAQIKFFFERLDAFSPNIFIDVGANNGIYTLLSANLDSVKEIYSFEPSDPHFSILKHNVSMEQSSKRYNLFKSACSSDNSKYDFVVFPEDYPSLNHIYTTKILDDNRIRKYNGELIKIETVIIDGLINTVNSRIGIKIDTEGHELEVLKGMSALLKNNNCFLQIESFSNEIGQYLLNYGYKYLKSINHDHYYIKY